MKVSKQFLRDFAYIANLYSWNAADVEDAKTQTRTSPDEMCRYWTQLAAAHRAGYAQTQGNNYMRLGHWLQIQACGAPGEFRDQHARGGLMRMTASQPQGYVKGRDGPQDNLKGTAANSADSAHARVGER
jgi:hypothetical protein